MLTIPFKYNSYADVMRIRESARAILLNPENALLLFQFYDPNVSDPNSTAQKSLFWATVGGAVKAGESLEAALEREIWEETGIKDMRIGEKIAVREVVLDFSGELVRCLEHFFVVWVGSSHVQPAALELVEQKTMRQWRWWQLEDIVTNPEQATIFPENLAELMQKSLQLEQE